MGKGVQTFAEKKMQMVDGSTHTLKAEKCKLKQWGRGCLMGKIAYQIEKCTLKKLLCWLGYSEMDTVTCNW